MASAAQVRGMLLEEVILALLRVSGFRTVTAPTPTDPTLSHGSSGMQVCGRASRHQIDAIADFRVSMPFTYPPRLLVEGKCYTGKSVGIEVIRNAIGVMKDINEFFDPRAKPPIQRWHYQYAVFSATGFSAGAEAYAYAHDIYPVPLAHVAALAPIVAEIQEVDEVLARHIHAPLSRLRSAIRSTFGRALPPQMPGVEWDVPDQLAPLIDSIATQMERLGGALLARLTSGLPLFLVPPNRQALARLLEMQHGEVRIRYAREDGWWIEWRGERILDFDLPLEVFRTHDEAGMFRRRDALGFKEEQMAELQAIYAPPGVPPRIIVLSLSRDWIAQMREALRHDERD